VLKRIRWMVAGALVGAGSSLWARHKARSVMARYAPRAITGGALNRARELPGDVRDAVRVGRSAMREREAELRDGPSGPAGRPARRP
jgi:hypothetical protein